jgi:hypothetical protein
VKNSKLTAATVRLYNMRKALRLDIKIILDFLNITGSTLYRWIHMYNDKKLPFVDNPKASVEKKPTRGCPKKFRMYVLIILLHTLRITLNLIKCLGKEYLTFLM